jgi:hypothetical protein
MRQENDDKKLIVNYVDCRFCGMLGFFTNYNFFILHAFDGV